MQSKRRSLNLVLLLLGVLLGTPAHAYERTKTCTQTGQFACGPKELAKDVFWPTRDLVYHVNEMGSDDFPSPKESNTLLKLIDDCFGTWLAPECAEFSVTYQGLTTQDAKVFFPSRPELAPQENVIHFYEEWPYGGKNTVFAVTFVSNSRETGEIYDADIVFNGELYNFTDVDNPNDMQADLRNVLTHEIGHYLGFAHSNVEEATMFDTAKVGDTIRRDLAQDDLDVLCLAYEPLPKPEPEPVEDEGCCATTPTHSPSPPWLLVVSLVACVVWRRGRTRS